MKAIELGVEFGTRIYVFWGGRERTESDSSKNAVEAIKRSREKVKALKALPFDRPAIGSRGQVYKWLDQLTIELLLGTR